MLVYTNGADPSFLPTGESVFPVDDPEEVSASDVLVVDSYHLTPSFFAQAKAVSRCVCCFDDCGELPYPAAIIVNGNVYGEGIRYPSLPGSRLLLGPRFAAMRRSFWDVPERPVRSRVERVLVALGGTKTAEGLRMAAGLAAALPGVIVDVVVSGPDVRTASAGEARVTCAAGDGEMVDLMLNADIAVTGGGAVMLELARCGVPTIAAVFSDNQVLNVSTWAEKGFAVATTDDVLTGPVGPLAEMIGCLDSDKRGRMGRVGRELVDGQGARRVVAEIAGALEEMGGLDLA